MRLPELEPAESRSTLRIPPGVSLPLTARLQAAIDTAEMRRLARVGQLGLVALVYPGAVHSRFEHSLGVFRLALAFIDRLRADAVFTDRVDSEDASAFLAASLLHDVGHWPFCHPIEDMRLAEFPRHESFLRDIILGGELAEVLRREWGVQPERVASLVEGTAEDPAGQLLASLLSGPVDVDKMDYLSRDSLHAGVPYGRHFDEERLLASLCVASDGHSLAITSKGVTAAELMVFARYVMFSEVYWHHAVRAATAMLQRAVWLLRNRVDPRQLVRFDDSAFVAWIREASAGTPAAPLTEGLFGSRRTLFKRVASFDAREHPRLHAAVAGRSYADLVAIAERLAERLTASLHRPISADTLLLDAPPAEKEVEFRLEVRMPAHSRNAWRSLESLSPVVRALAHEQFDDLVKQVRLFAPQDDARMIQNSDGLEEMLLEAVQDVCHE
jgi:HD superfamily phosphohydrolase